MKHFLFLCTMIVSTLAQALPDDQHQELQLSATHAEFDQANETATYIGNVVIRQGSRRLFGDKAILYRNKKGELEKMIIHGSPAYFRYIPQVGDPEVHGESLVMHYYANLDLVVMTDQAVLEQNDDTYRAPEIEYSFTENRMYSAPSNEGRTQIIIKPETLSPSGTDSPLSQG